MWTALAVIGIALGISALAMAAGPGSHGQRARQITVAPSDSLTTTQLQRLERIRSDLEKKTLPLESRVESKRMELDALMSSSEPDLERARSLRAEIRQLESQLDDAWLEASGEVSRILTPEQRAQGAAPSAWLMGNGGWYDGWSCPRDRGAGYDWNYDGHNRYARSWGHRDSYARGSNRWYGPRMGGHAGCCW